jgi:hypothetical protein
MFCRYKDRAHASLSSCQPSGKACICTTRVAPPSGDDKATHIFGQCGAQRRNSTLPSDCIAAPKGMRCCRIIRSCTADASGVPRSVSWLTKRLIHNNYCDESNWHGYGRSTTLMTPSFLSRNFLYISGASSNRAGWVTTKLGSIFPVSIIASSGFV